MFYRPDKGWIELLALIVLDFRSQLHEQLTVTCFQGNSFQITRRDSLRLLYNRLNLFPSLGDPIPLVDKISDLIAEKAAVLPFFGPLAECKPGCKSDQSSDQPV